MLIRPARPEDVDAIARFIAMAESEILELLFGTDDFEAARPFLTELILSPRTCRYGLSLNTVAELDDRPVGSVISFPADRQPELDGPLLDALRPRIDVPRRLTFEGEPGTYYLSTMGVAPEVRGQGIGGRLMAAVEEEGRRQGFDRASLLVSKTKPRAQAMYERRGYAATDLVRIQDVEYHRMVKPL